MLELVLLTAVVGALALWWVLTPDRRLKEMGDKIPGPSPWPILGNIFNFNIFGPDAPADYKKCMKKYGNTFRFWLGPQLHIFITEPDDIQMILSSQKLITKSASYEPLCAWLGTGLLVSAGDLWFKRRKAITPTFHFKILDEFVPTFNKCSQTLVNLLKEKAGKGFFPLTDYVSNCALDAVAETAMGTELKAQTNPLGEYPTSLNQITTSLMRKINNPLLGMEPIYTLSGRRKKEAKLLNILFSLPLDLIKKNENKKPAEADLKQAEEEALGVKKRTAFLELLLKMKQDKAPTFQTENDIKDEVMTFMFEGHDTTTMALTYTLWLLGSHPEIQEELYNEVSSILGGQDPTMEDYQRMTYLERVLKESLRLYPSVPIIARIASEDVVLPSSGYVIPQGAQIDVVIFSVHRREDFFQDAEKFDPDRFLNPQKHPYSYVPFSAGPRNCIGQKFAMLDMKVIISHVVLNYKIKSDEDMVLNPELLLRAQRGPNISLTSRN